MTYAAWCSPREKRIDRGFASIYTQRHEGWIQKFLRMLETGLMASAYKFLRFVFDTKRNAIGEMGEMSDEKRKGRTMRAAIACLAELCALWALCCSRVEAHEFWMWARPFSAPAGAVTHLTLHVGQYFEGDLAGFTTAHAVAVHDYSQDKTEDLRARLPSDFALPELRLQLKGAGTHVVAYDSVPSTITLSADKFHAYLHDEGLDAVIQKREASGTAALPGRERFRRCIKTLLTAGGKSDATATVRTGQRLELVPMSDPNLKAEGDTLAFGLFFDGHPLAGTLVKAWYRHEGQTLLIRARTDENGRVAFSLPYAGGWMLSTVHMIPALDTAEADWDSYWGNLTFELPRRQAK
jgi:hypothetical protein